MLASVLLSLCIAGLIMGAIMLIKNEVTWHNRMIVFNAIFLYCRDVVDHHDFSESDDPPYMVYFGDEEDYEKTLYRLWDWGYTRILPPDKFEIIKPYIKAAKGMK